jgi:hypothetical protein
MAKRAAELVAGKAPRKTKAAAKAAAPKKGGGADHSVPLTVYMRRGRRDAIEAEAARERRPTSQMADILIAEALDARAARKR